MSLENLKAHVAAIAHHAQAALPKGLGFTLLVFDFGERGGLAYASNADRDDMLRTMHDFLHTVGGAALREIATVAAAAPPPAKMPSQARDHGQEVAISRTLLRRIVGDLLFFSAFVEEVAQTVNSSALAARAQLATQHAIELGHDAFIDLDHEDLDD